MTKEEICSRYQTLMAERPDAEDMYMLLVQHFEKEIARLKDLRCNSVLISQEDVDFLQEQNQRYADLVAYLEDEIVAEFEGKAYKVESSYKQETALQSDSMSNDESYVSFLLSSTYGDLEVGKCYKVIIKECKDK